MLHPYIQYLRYRWAARGRHGTHSPFVYHLVESVVHTCPPPDTHTPVIAGLSPRYAQLAQHIASSLSYTLCTGAAAQDPSLLVLGTSPRQWSATAIAPLLIGTQHILLLPGIHSHPAATQAWRSICAQPFVRRSIDFYGMGLLLAHSSFRQKEHFIIAY